MKQDSWAYGPAKKRHVRFRRKAITVALVFGTMVASTVAFAAWTTNGLGFGRSKAGAMQALTITPTNVQVSGYLYPGGNGDISFKITNPNTQFAVQLDSIAATGPFTLDPSGDALACALTVNAAALTAAVAGQTVPPSADTQFDVAGGASMGSSAADSCQGQSFLVPLSVTAHNV